MRYDDDEKLLCVDELKQNCGQKFCFYSNSLNWKDLTLFFYSSTQVVYNCYKITGTPTAYQNNLAHRIICTQNQV